MNRMYSLCLGMISMATVAIMAMAAPAFAFAARAYERIEVAWGIAFDVRPTIERSILPSLMATEADRQTTSLAIVRSFVTRRSTRTQVGRGSGDPCSSLAFAA